MRNARYLVCRRYSRPSCRALIRAFSIVFMIIIIGSFLIPSRAEAQSDDPITVGYFNNRPLSYRVNGDLIGLSIDLLREIGHSEGWELEFREGTRYECHEWITSGEVDIVAGLEEIPELDGGPSFSNETIVTNWGVIYTPEGEKLDSILDLESKWVGVVKDDIQYNGSSGLRDLLSAFGIDATMVEFGNYNEVIRAIEDDVVDVGLLNHLVGQAVEKERDISRTGVVFNPVDVKFAYPANDTQAEELSKTIDRYIKDMKGDESSIYYSLLKDYVGGDSGPKVRVVLPSWLINLFLIVIGVAIFLFAATMFLRHRVRARTRELEIANQELDLDIKKRIEIEGRLKDERNKSVFYLDLLLHDMGNINQGLLNSAQIYDLVKKDRSKADMVHDTISQLVSRSVSLVKNVHKFAQATNAPFRAEPIDLIPVVKKSLTSVILSFPELKISTDIRGPKENVYVPAEPLIEEVFYNIFHNAVKYHEQGDPKIEVKIRVDRIKKRVILEIADRGRGIPDSMKHSLFTRAKRAGEAKHLGMGLSLVKVLLDRYQGTIEVKDRVEGDHKMGSKFIVMLPIMEDPSV